MKQKTVQQKPLVKPKCSVCGSGQVYTRKSRIVPGSRERVCIKCGHEETLKEVR